MFPFLILIPKPYPKLFKMERLWDGYLKKFPPGNSDVQPRLRITCYGAICVPFPSPLTSCMTELYDLGYREEEGHRGKGDKRSLCLTWCVSVGSWSDGLQEASNSFLENNLFARDKFIIINFVPWI